MPVPRVIETAAHTEARHALIAAHREVETTWAAYIRQWGRQEYRTYYKAFLRFAQAYRRYVFLENTEPIRYEE